MSQQINLFNAGFKRKKNYATTRAMATGLGALVLVLTVASVLANIELATLEREAAVVKAELAAREARRIAVTSTFVAPRKSEALQQELDQTGVQYRNLQQVAAILDQGEPGATRGYSAYFRAFARRGIDGLWLTGVTIQGSGEAIGLQGRALKASLLPGYLNGLAGEAVLRGKTFGQLQMTEPKAPPKAAAADGVSAPEPAAAPRYVEFSLQSAAAGEQAKVEQP
ncbi:MSHA biogenesis protein MshI [Rugamonas aquatica]|uniref:MSHA biogenesis protein MshI n=1 Tax=Rugamonas aquatica TaxID=2743357 RepID=A0A6A7N9M2_9BURK|nr:MSHA biogenesis protein MshI [Rugamonas aquatica]MQA41785.1 MSHA biogenesis protein MshI [Rugamonas aquatica]